MRTTTGGGRARRAVAALALLVLAAACGGGGGGAASDEAAGSDAADTADAGGAASSEAAAGGAASSEAGEAGEATADASAASEGAGDAAGGEDLGTLSVGLICGGLTPMTAMIAMNAQTFPDGLEVEKVCFDGGSEAVQALIGGSLDVFMGSVEHVVSTRAQGLPTQAYAVINNRMPYWLITPGDSEVQSVADLAGQNVGITSSGSLSDTQLQVAADQEGVAYEEMRVVDAGSGPTMTAALDSGSVAAGMVSDPVLSELIAQDYRVLWEPEMEYVSIVALTNSERIAEREPAMRAFLQGLQAAYEQSEDPEFAVEAMREEGFQVSDEALQEAVERGLTEIPEDLQVDEATYQETVDLLVGVGRVEESEVPPFDEAFNFEWLPTSG